MRVNNRAMEILTYYKAQVEAQKTVDIEFFGEKNGDSSISPNLWIE
jgi:hypothetical protein